MQAPFFLKWWSHEFTSPAFLAILVYTNIDPTWYEYEAKC